VVTARQLKAFIEILADVMREDVRDADERQQILARLNTLASSVDQMLRDSQWSLSDAAGSAEPASAAVSGDQDLISDAGASSDDYNA
jgi:hypothetical protein